MEAEVHQVGGGLLDHRIKAGVVGDYEGDVVLAEQVDELRDEKALVADLDDVADGAVGARFDGRVPGPVVVVAGEAGGGVVVGWEQLEERVETHLAEAEPLGELPQDGAELGAEGEDPLAEEVGQRLAGIVELLHVGDEPAALDGEDEVVGRGAVPGLEIRFPLERVERAVDLHGGEPATGVLHFGPLREAIGIKLATPAGVTPAGDADADRPRRRSTRRTRPSRAAG
jgi:hypothetical protein